MSNDDYNNGFIAVHVGAGNHAESQKKNYQKLCKEACINGIKIIKNGKTYIDAVVEATKILENSPLTNAGYGSNLTLKGGVECDASIMDGNNLNFGAIGAVGSIKNPIYLAKCICESQNKRISHGRIAPNFIVGNGGREWAKEHPEYNIDIVDNNDLISPKANKIWNHYKRKIENNKNNDNEDDVDDKIVCKKQKINDDVDDNKRLDTVGAIFVDKYGNVSSACSSGGIILKSTGRVGQAGVWGCGVWAENGDVSVASSTTGCGEHLIKTTLAKTLAESIKTNNNTDDYVKNINDTMMNDFIKSKYLIDVEQKLGGGIVLRYDKANNFGELLWTHSTNSMILGYMNSNDDKANSFVSIMNSQNVGKKVVVEGVGFKL